jgi:uncharacterized protein YqgC (DUF456 family)
VDGFDGDRVAHLVSTLSIPRRLDSEGARKTIDLLTETFHEIELPLQEAYFSFSGVALEIGGRILGLFGWGVLLLALSLHGRLTSVSVALIGGLLAGLALGTRWSGSVEWLYDLKLLRKRSLNLIARISPDSIRGHLILLAHYDSKSQSLPLFLRVVLQALILTGLATLSALYLVLLVTAEEWIPVLWPPALLLAVPLLLLLFNTSGNRSPGGIDNAAGLAVLVEVARALKMKPPGKIEIVFVLTGAEEEGLAGAIRFIQTMGAFYKPHNSFFVNLDGIGAPKGIPGGLADQLQRGSGDALHSHREGPAGTRRYRCTEGWVQAHPRTGERTGNGGQCLMDVFLFYLGMAGLYFGLLLGLFLVPLGLPGNWLIFGIALLKAWLGDFQSLTLPWILFLLSLAVVGEVVEFLLGVYVARRYGASRWGMLGAFFGGLVGGILGTPFFPPIGTMIGAFIGAFLGAFSLEYLYRMRSDVSYRAGIGAFVGRILAVVLKLEMGFAMVLVIIIKG